MAALIVDIGMYYVIAGAAVAALFVTVGVGMVSPGARGSWLFRPLLIPGAVLLWPLVAAIWVKRWRTPPEPALQRPPRRLQDRLALALVLALPVILAVGISLRQNGPYERPAQRLAPPAAVAGDQP